LLRWGEFSNEYVKEARLLKQKDEESGWMWRSFGKIVGLSIFGPLITVVPFLLKVTDDCVDSLIGHSIWFGGKHEFTFVFFLFSHSFSHLTHFICALHEYSCW
jgi:hypothetical protein